MATISLRPNLFPKMVVNLIEGVLEAENLFMTPSHLIESMTDCITSIEIESMIPKF